MRNLQRVLALLSVVTVALYGCDKAPEVTAVPKFDAKTVAAEADKGNLGPLTELNHACSAEVQKFGNRSVVCKVQDEVRSLRKPISIRF